MTARLGDGMPLPDPRPDNLVWIDLTDMTGPDPTVDVHPAARWR